MHHSFSVVLNCLIILFSGLMLPRHKVAFLSLFSINIACWRALQLSPLIFRLWSILNCVYHRLFIDSLITLNFNKKDKISRMMQIIKLNIGSSSHNGKKEESQPKEIAKGNLKIKYCYKRNQSRNNDYQPINYGNNFNDQRHFQQLQNQKQIKQYGKSQNFCSLNPEVGMIQSFNPL